MPVKTCLSNILSTRFDFGVPLEDVFPPNDIHPRLKYLFAKAYESFTRHGSNIENILRYGQGTIKENLKLKEKLVLDLDYHIDIDKFSPGSYFWVLRHFLGLLPLPVMPNYTKCTQFDWNDLAEECKKFLRNSDSERKNKHVLDYDIAQTINMLPFENFILLNFLIVFIRKISIKTVRGRQIFDKKSVMFLSKYYCSSIFVRPFRPGYLLKNDAYLPLLLYLILRWQKISKNCETIGHPAYFLECDFRNLECYKNFGLRDNCTQTNILNNAFFNSDVVSVCRNIPYFVNICSNYLKDIGCQTDTDLSGDNNGRDFCTIPEETEQSNVNLDEVNQDKNYCLDKGINDKNGKAYTLAYIDEEPSELLQNDVVMDNNDTTLYQTATDFSLKSVLDQEENRDWRNIVKETMDTVKKVEESYIYDDYETFKKEDFNQIGKNRSSSLLSRISKYGFTYSPRKNPTGEEISSTPKKISPESDSSYVKYADVCEHVDIEDHRINNFDLTNPEKNEIKISNDKLRDKIRSNNPVSQKLFHDDSPRSFHADNSKQDLQNNGDSRKRKRYVLKKIRLSLKFLRALTPKKSTFKNLESRIKYRRIKNGKSNTI